jgi:hypothetical protein
VEKSENEEAVSGFVQLQVLRMVAPRLQLSHAERSRRLCFELDHSRRNLHEAMANSSDKTLTAGRMAGNKTLDSCDVKFLEPHMLSDPALIGTTCLLPETSKPPNPQTTINESNRLVPDEHFPESLTGTSYQVNVGVPSLNSSLLSGAISL